MRPIIALLNLPGPPLLLLLTFIFMYVYMYVVYIDICVWGAILTSGGGQLLGVIQMESGQLVGQRRVHFAICRGHHDGVARYHRGQSCFS